MVRLVVLACSELVCALRLKLDVFFDSGVLERAKAELGSVFAMVPGILVSKEEVIGWSEDVLNHDSVSPGTEADSNGGPLVRIMSPRTATEDRCVLERAKAELGSVFAMVPGILVSKEEVIGWSEDVLNHDSVSPGTEADSNGGPLDASVWVLEVDVWEKSELSGGDWVLEVDVWEKSELSEVVEGDEVFTPGTLMMSRGPEPDECSKAKVLVVELLEIGKGELGSVLPGSSEEVMEWSEDVLNQDSVSSGTEADSNGGPLDASVWALEVDVWEKSELSGGDVLGLCLSDAEAGTVSATPGRALETGAALVGPLSAVLATGEGAEVVAQLSSLLGVPGSDKAADAGRLSTVTSAVVGGWTLVLSGTEVVDGDVVFTPEALVTLKLAGIPRSSDIKVLVVLMPAESLAPVNVEFFSVVSVVLPSVTGGVVTAVTVPPAG
ncbi:hypothetical protein CB1_000418040 [Camelus ferus]|nr:hypothetical protein CB1_000418040 [Camelus ferus]